MKTVLWLLGALGLLGAFDTIYFHEIRGQLPARLPGLGPELRLHAGRSFIYVAVFGTLPWLAWRGAWALALGMLLAIEIGITLADFIVEDQVRKPFGGLHPGERATHTIMAIVYGAMIANLIPVLLAWHRSVTGLRPEPVDVPLAYRLTLAALAAGTCVSAVRDAYAVAGFPRPTARWPWPAQSGPQP
ncbi:MAG TPA: hypothetical protein VGS19_22635 [Streptosporangiaceae bacterium]|nr:hypothetical protein [Streptosporangiaceae bacterium]